MQYQIKNAAYLIISTLIVCLSACSSLSDSEDAAWLHGVWQLTHNPDKDTSDKLLFREDGTVMVQTEDNQEIHGKYLINGHHLNITLATNNKVIDLEFTISGDKKKLIYETGAFYTKQQ